MTLSDSKRLPGQCGFNFSCLGWFASPLMLIALSGNSATYYLDEVGGNDSSSGTTSNAAWRTLGKVNSRTFTAGDRVLLKAGGAWTGELALNGNGAPGNPIVVDRYGSGSKPRIDGGGYESAVRLQGVSYWEVNNLEIVNNGGPTLSGATSYRAGVLVKSVGNGVRNHIHLMDLSVHDVFPETGPYGHGIHVIAACSATVDTYYDDVRIEGCEISRTGRFGAWVQQTGSTLADPAYRFIRDVVIRNNTFTHTGGSGAETGWCRGVLLEGNVVHNSGASVDPRQWARGSGYWPWKCTDVLVQFNEFRHARGEADSCGVHIDYGNRNVTIQYNLSLDNEGGFVEILGDCVNSTYRYNMSINDGARIKGVNGASQDGHLIWLSDYVGDSVPGVGSVNSRIYNNTIYVRPGITNYIKIMARSQDTYIQNNLFYISGRTIYTDAGTNTLFQNNLWHGNLPAGIPIGDGSVLNNPLLLRAGGTNVADYALSPVSPAIAAGTVIASNGGRDYWGDPLPPGPPCIGADERAFDGSQMISVDFTDATNGTHNIPEGGSYGISAEGSVTPGWLNLYRTLSSLNLPLANGFPSSVMISGTAPSGWATCNQAYTNTPLLGGVDDYTGSASPAVTLTHLSDSYPGGYKIIAYLSGFNSNMGASISDGSTTFYYRALNNPGSEFTGALTRTTATTDLGDNNNPFAQYAVFGEPEPLTNNAITLTLQALYGGGAILGGFQVLPPTLRTPNGVPHAWFQSHGLPVDDSADTDADGVPAWQEYYAGTDPTNALSSFRVIDSHRAGTNIVLVWLGGTNGFPGNWSMFVSSNLTTWSVLASKSIPRHASGTNTWVHTNAAPSATTLFYRPGVELTR